MIEPHFLTKTPGHDRQGTRICIVSPRTTRLWVLAELDPSASVTQMNDFGRRVEGKIAQLRRYARALTHDVIHADDLVQDCLARAIAKQHLWQPGTDLRAWLFTILHNQYVSDLRHSARGGTNVLIEDAEPALTIQPNAIHVLQLCDLEAAMARLAPEPRQVILLIGLEGMSYDEAAAVLGIPVGTVRSRL